MLLHADMLNNSPYKKQLNDILMENRVMRTLNSFREVTSLKSFLHFCYTNRRQIDLTKKKHIRGN